jgi:3-hydroxyacyl-CoA dehydrogenase
VLDDLEAFVTSGLGKGVVRAHDTPNFIANRVGIAGMLATMKEVENFGLTYDVVDDLTGKKLGRASSAAPSAPPTWWAWTPWPTSSRPCRTT